MTEAYKEDVLDRYHRLAMEMTESRLATTGAIELAGAVLGCLTRISDLRRDLETLTAGFDEPITAAEVVRLKRELAEMTRREERWRRECLTIGSARAQESVSAFSSFCDGHKAAHNQIRKA